VGAHPERAPPKIGKNKIFWRKIVIFHTKYLKNCRASLRSAQFFLSAPPNLKSWIRPWIGCALRVFQLLSPTPKNLIFSNFRGGALRVRPHPGSAPAIMGKQLVNFIICGCESNAPFL
jgi:hypothetical protein